MTAVLPDPLPPAFDTADVGGVPVARLSFDETVRLVARWLDEPGPRRVATANLDFLRLASSDPEFRGALATCHLVTADGAPVVWLARMAGTPVPERVAGADLVPSIVAEAARLGRSVYLLGGAPGVAAQAARRLREANPGLVVAGTAHPQIDLTNDALCAEVAAAVRASRADLLLVALGAPRQDVFLQRWVKSTGCRVGIAVGGTFDFIAGRVRRAPPPLRAAGLEWSYRLAMEPRRLGGRYLRDAAHLVRLVVRRPARISASSEARERS
jgi:N-acetylglucosaminyldiphosphoundecaprenol N-acetyl-beta-D-mannosaminyltransferase